MHEPQKRALISQAAKKWNVIEWLVPYYCFLSIEFPPPSPRFFIKRKKEDHTSDYIRLEQSHNLSYIDLDIVFEVWISYVSFLSSRKYGISDYFGVPKG